MDLRKPMAEAMTPHTEGDAGRDSKLLPCPFCGGEAEWVHLLSAGGDAEIGKNRFLQCSSLDCFGPRTTAVDESAIEQWNTRAQPPQPSGEPSRPFAAAEAELANRIGCPQPSGAREAPASCPNCHDRTDCSNVDVCNAVEQAYAHPSGDVKTAIAWLRRASSTIYLACEESVAADISKHLTDTATLLESLDSRTTAQTWKPIDTAPKDGTLVLICGNGDGGYYVADAKYDGRYWCLFNVDADDWTEPCFAPTHWMPLPPPPTALSTEQGER